MSTLLRQDTFECYQYYKQPSSLLTSAFKWLVIHVGLLIFYLPLSIILFVSLLLSLCCKETQIVNINKNEKLLNAGANQSQQPLKYTVCRRIKLLVNPAVLYLFFTSLLLILYIIDVFYDVIHHLHIEEFFTLTPYVLFILFKDAVVYSLNMRKALLTASLIFANTPCCVPYIKLFTWILKNYWIWGVKINPASKPQNEPEPKLQNNNSVNSIISNYIPLDFKQVPLCYNVGRLHIIYNRCEYIFFLLSVVAGLGFIFASFSYYIYNYYQTSADVVLLWIIFAIGIIVKIFTVLCVARFIELIFQGFQIYYDHMKELSEEIEFGNVYDKDINDHYIQINKIKEPDYRLKPYDAIRKPSYGLHQDKEHEPDSISRRTSFFIESVHGNDRIEQKHNEDECKHEVIDLSSKDAWIIWFENWCRIEKLSSLYFHNRQNIVFGIVVSTIMAITVTFYQIFILETVIDELNLSCFCGLVYVIIVVLRFILWSFTFGTLEMKHVRLIRKQKMYINHKKILLYKRNNIGNDILSMNLNEQISIQNNYIQYKVEEYDSICKYLEDVIHHIEDRSLCPKIAGVTLNKAFVNLTITSILTYAFAFVLYRLRQDYIHDK